MFDYKKYINSAAIINEIKTDLNYDGQQDYLIYSNQGEETYLDVLLKNDHGYLAISIPTGEEYEIISNNSKSEIRVATGTFPTYGSPQGGDIHYWYDFYLIKDKSIVLNNIEHAVFYKEQMLKYQNRIADIESNIPEMVRQFKKEDLDEYFIETQVKWKKQTIGSYENFIRKANGIIKNKL